MPKNRPYERETPTEFRRRMEADQASDRTAAAMDAKTRAERPGVAAATGKGEDTSGAEREPVAADFGGDLVKWSKARAEWRKRRDASPQRQALKSLATGSK